MNGYIGNSMSVRAKHAYDAGEKPLSKFTGAEVRPLGVTLRQAKALATLRYYDGGWRYSSKHHTSKKYNYTYFYDIDDLAELIEEDGLDTVKARADSVIANDSPGDEDEDRDVKVCVCYGEWGGTKRRPEFFVNDFLNAGKKTGNWIQLNTIAASKKADGNWIAWTYDEDARRGWWTYTGQIDIDKLPPPKTYLAIRRLECKQARERAEYQRSEEQKRAAAPEKSETIGDVFNVPPMPIKEWLRSNDRHPAPQNIYQMKIQSGLCWREFEHRQRAEQREVTA